MSQLSTFYSPLTAADLGLGNSANVTFGSVTTGAVTSSGNATFGSIQNTPIGSTTRNTGAFTTLNANNGTITSSAPVLDLSQTWNNSGVTFVANQTNVTDTASAASSVLHRFNVGGTTVFQIEKDGTLRFGTASGIGRIFVSPSDRVNGALELKGNSNGVVSDSIRVTPNSGSGSSTALVRSFEDMQVGPVANNRFLRLQSNGTQPILLQSGNHTVEQYNTTNPQTFRLYNTFTDASNHERGFMRWSSNNFEIGSEAAGTGTAREVRIVAGTSTYRFATNSNAIFPGTINIGGAAEYQWFNRSRLRSSASGLIELLDSAGTSFDRLQFGGTTSSFPALKRSSTTLQVRLADDSAFAPLVSSQVGIGVASPERPLHIQTSDAMGRIDRTGANGPAFLMVRMATLGSVTSSWLFGPATGFASVANDDFSIIDFGSTTSGTSGTQRLTIAKSDGQLTVNGNLNLSTKDLVTDTTTGTKIGTGTTQKLGFYGATPVDRPDTVSDAATQDLTGSDTLDKTKVEADLTSCKTAINAIIDRLQELGLIA